jgi:hypothetical protein
MGQALSLPFKIAKTTSDFYFGLFHYLWGKGRHSEYLPFKDSTCPYFRPDFSKDDEETLLFKKNARIHLYSIASSFYMFHKPHYRKASYREDLIDNLRNVAIPGTGLPLSLFVYTKLSALGFVLAASPACSLISSLHLWFKSGFQSSISKEYATRLLAPNDWFNYWRMNCNIASLHALMHDVPKGYTMENKWTFLKDGDALGVPVSPFLRSPALVIKHKNEEGGLGIFFYKNATEGGDWILQEKIDNSDWVSSLLPENPPLSTFRVITQSYASIHPQNEPRINDISALSCVFRAGRKGASTDHSSILFDVDVNTGIIGGGTTNEHWYKLGLRPILPGGCKWRSFHGEYSTHPDCDKIKVTGQTVPNIRSMIDLVRESHLKLCPDVPLVGWDVVFSKDSKLPVCLLEVNLSCNFFRGTFDKKTYLDFLDESIVNLQAMRLTADVDKKVFPQNNIGAM